MIAEFSVENYKSFKELQTLNLQATSIKEPADLDYNRIFLGNQNTGLLKGKAIFGGNASGKSNLIKAMASFWKIMQQNLLPDNILEYMISPFKLDNDYLKKPTFFQLIIILDGVQYRYGFEADTERIHSEWLFVKHKTEVPYFEREGQEITYWNKNKFGEIKSVLSSENKLYKTNTLILSVLNALNTPVASQVHDGILNRIAIDPGLDNKHFGGYTISKIKESNEFKLFVSDLLSSMDDTIKDVYIETINVVGSQLKDQKIDIPVTVRVVKKKKVPFNLFEEEADGTKKIFSFAGQLYNSLKTGGTFIIDEFDAKLHPKLSRKIISLFYSTDAHPEAQLIFVTHDSNLMDAKLLRRDQITFVEKSKTGESEIYDLSDIQGVRENDLFEKNYLKGKYGGLPHLKILKTKISNG